MLTALTNRIKGWFTKSSRGEEAIAKMLGHFSGHTAYGWPFAGNRVELASHMTGWNYVAIDAIATQFAGMTPQVAMRVDAHDPVGAPTGGGYDNPDNRLNGFNRSLRSVSNGKCLNHWQRRKALAPIQEHEELEPVSADHDLVRLLANPNGPDVAWTFFYKCAMYLRLCGECYIWVIPNKLGLPCEMWVIPSHWVWPIAGEYELVKDYEVRPTAGWVPAEQGGFAWFPGAIGVSKIRGDQVIAVKYPNPMTPILGYSPLQAGARWVDCTDNVDRSRVNVFKNDAFPGVVLEIDKDFRAPDDDGQLESLKQTLVNRWTDVRNRGVPVVLGPGMTLKRIQNNPIEMDYERSASQLKDWILALHRTGSANVNMADSVDYASMIAANANWHGSVLKPMAVLFGQVFTEGVARKFDKRMTVFWPDTVPDDPDFMHKRMIDLLDRDGMLINEARAGIGLDPVAWGDKPLSVIRAENAIPGGFGQIVRVMTNAEEGMPRGTPQGVDGQVDQDPNLLGGMNNDATPVPSVLDRRRDLLARLLNPSAAKALLARRVLTQSEYDRLKPSTNGKH